MKITTLLLPSLLLIGSAAAIPSHEPTTISVAGDAFDALKADFDMTVEMWNEDMEKATTDERRELRKSKPAAEFWDQFKVLADGGNGRAMLWMVSNIRDSEIKSKKRGLVLADLFGTLAKEHSNADWFGDVLAQTKGASRRMGSESTLAFYEAVIANTNNDESRAGALFGAGFLLKGSEDKKLQARGEAYIVRVEKELADTSWAAKLTEARAEEAVQVGRIAPDFSGKTIDGFEFDLSDYKGKVVMLDFYGFW